MKDIIKDMYSNLLFVQKVANESGKSNKEINDLPYVIRTKKEIRAKIKEFNIYMDAMSKRHYDKDYCSYWELIRLPGESVHNAEKILFSKFYLHLPESQYDCTGREFTSSYGIYPLLDGSVIYHRVSRDV